MMTLTSRGGSIPSEMASMRMDGSAWPKVRWLEVNSAIGAATRPVSSGCETPEVPKDPVGRGLVAPGEGDLVERLRSELLGRTRHHAAAEGAVKLGRGFVVRERPDHHALQSAL